MIFIIDDDTKDFDDITIITYEGQCFIMGVGIEGMVIFDYTINGDTLTISNIQGVGNDSVEINGDYTR